MQLNEMRNGLVAAPAWKTLLETETQEVDRAGVQAAVVVVQLAAPIDLLDPTPERTGTAEHALLKECLRPTDRLAQTSETSLSVLVTPTSTLAETIEHVYRIDAAFLKAGFDALCSFAQRRPEENLVDSWGRAQAELDRTIFRNNDGGFVAL